MVDAFNSKLKVGLLLEFGFLSIIKYKEIFGFIKTVNPDYKEIGRSETEGVEDVDNEEGKE